MLVHHEFQSGGQREPRQPISAEWRELVAVAPLGVPEFTRFQSRADRHEIERKDRARFFTLSYLSGGEKRRRCARMLETVRRAYTVAGTQALLDRVEVGP